MEHGTVYQRLFRQEEVTEYIPANQEGEKKDSGGRNEMVLLVDFPFL